MARNFDKEHLPEDEKETVFPLAHGGGRVQETFKGQTFRLGKGD